jgi:hypothetical protein
MLQLDRKDFRLIDFSIADCIQIKWSIHQFRSMPAEFMTELPNDCRRLKQLLQVSAHVHAVNRMTWAYREHINPVNHGRL